MDKSGAGLLPGAGFFTGTASYYSRFRLPYPDALFDLIATTFGLDGNSQVLDLGTGTGQLAIPLAGCCAAVVAADINPEMIAEARRVAAESGVSNVRWLILAAEEITPALGRFQLVTIGQAFHWMDREEVLRRLDSVLTPGSGIALVGGTTIWDAPEPWAQATMAVIRRWLGEERRVGSGVHTSTRASNHRPFEEVLAGGGYGRQQGGEYVFEHIWDLDGIIGHLYSTSYCNPALFGENRAAFEADLRQTLLDLQPDGRFAQAIRVDYLFGWRG
jgi:SAM-dependent methyltransferase